MYHEVAAFHDFNKCLKNVEQPYTTSRWHGALAWGAKNSFPRDKEMAKLMEEPADDAAPFFHPTRAHPKTLSLPPFALLAPIRSLVARASFPIGVVQQQFGKYFSTSL